jgi:hypothetical protein
VTLSSPGKSSPKSTPITKYVGCGVNLLRRQFEIDGGGFVAAAELIGVEAHPTDRGAVPNCNRLRPDSQRIDQFLPPPEDKYGNESVEDMMARVRKYRDLADRFLKFVSDREKGHHAKAASG